MSPFIGRQNEELPELAPLALELLGLLVGLYPHNHYQLSPQECAQITDSPLAWALEALCQLQEERLAHCFYLDSSDPLEQTMWGLKDYDQAREVVRRLKGYDEDMTPPLPKLPTPGPRQRPSGLAERLSG
jgi:hypothetical protein